METLRTDYNMFAGTRIIRDMKTQTGFTMVELMITVGVIALLAAIAVPSMYTTAQKRRVQGAAESMYLMMTQARSESIKRSKDMYFRTSGENSIDWAFGITDNATGCDPTIIDASDSSACTIADFDNDGNDNDTYLIRADSEDFPNIWMGTGNDITFDWTTGTASATSYTFTDNSSGYRLKVSVGNIGRVRMCIPESSDPAIGGYKGC